MALSILLRVCQSLSASPELTKPRLVTVGFSHFCEKARWAMDLSPSEYVEEIHAPAVHLSATLQLASLPRVGTWTEHGFFGTLLAQRHDVKTNRRKETTGVPKLVLPEKLLFQKLVYTYVDKQKSIKSSAENASAGSGIVVVASGSSGILKLLSDVHSLQLGHLYPKGTTGQRVVELEHFLDTELASAATNWAFGNILLSGKGFHPAMPDASNSAVVDCLVDSFYQQRIPLVEKVIWNVFGRLFLIPLMIKANSVSSESREKARDDIHRIFSYMDSLLEEHNPTGSVSQGFLLGTDKITAADISFASFCAPIVLPPEANDFFVSYEALMRLAKRGEVSSPNPGAYEVIKLADEVRGTYRSAQYALDLYKTHRSRDRVPST